MGKVESEILHYIERRLEEGVLSVTEAEIMDAIIPGDHPEFRLRPSYRYGLERLLRRNRINGIKDSAGITHYFIGNYPSNELRESLGL
jgi:hypothetical protein